MRHQATGFSKKNPKPDACNLKPKTDRREER
jgi:hypothetical protein